MGSALCAAIGCLALRRVGLHECTIQDTPCVRDAIQPLLAPKKKFFRIVALDI